MGGGGDGREATNRPATPPSADLSMQTSEFLRPRVARNDGNGLYYLHVVGGKNIFATVMGRVPLQLESYKITKGETMPQNT